MSKVYCVKINTFNILKNVITEMLRENTVLNKLLKEYVDCIFKFKFTAANSLTSCYSKFFFFLKKSRTVQ